MPLYEYECDACGHRFEKIQKFSDPLEDKCPYTPEELAEMEKETGGRSPAELWKSLGVTPSS